MKILRKLHIRFILIAFAATLILTSCSKKREENLRIAVSNSYLESAAKEFLGSDEKILRLTEPGMCPGHFDVQPSHILKLSKCQLLLKFDFQKLLDERIFKDSTNKVIVSIKLNGGLCCPETYLEACKQTAFALEEQGLISPKAREEKLKEIGERLKKLSQKSHEIAGTSGLNGIPIIASAHQAEFCKWLGFDVVGKFSAADVASFQEIEKAIDAGKIKNVKFVIANKPEGRRLADALAERLGAKVIVFDNFPDVNVSLPFDNMLQKNITALNN
ncbi:MAG: zinc ABC transporter substrate-binding protein [Verrucomicrobiae bacterium]|nr:zinc ABC transporter substrate-binding protein [Verrucomicrobiae bacterium]